MPEQREPFEVAFEQLIDTYAYDLAFDDGIDYRNVIAIDGILYGVHLYIDIHRYPDPSYTG